ncbi:MAG TPA: hypothetical protein VGY55_09200 [Pirellulales bacterium]|jgi:hypothetical protein|nr:hypothetical protein [Pirellulales bacterium]
MFSLRWTAGAQAEYSRLKAAAEASAASRKKKEKAKSSKSEGLFKQVYKTLQLLAANPKHPSLQIHEYHSLVNPFHQTEKVFEAYAQNQTPGAYRVFWCYGPEKRQITIVDITSHP